MRSLNPLWSLAGFHAHIAKLAAIEPGSRVLDLGCGNGNGLPHLLAAVGPVGEVVAADRDQASLDRAKTTHADARLAIIHTDFAKKLPLADESFDRVICQNVIECVADRKGLLSEIHRILRPGGAAVVGHHDFDGVLLASDNRELTRRLVHGYADFTQSWQDESEGQMGRLLPGLFARSPCGQTETETVLFVDLGLSDGTYAKQHIGDMVRLSGQFGIGAGEAQKWLRDLEARTAAGIFYYALPWTYVIARR